VLADSAGVYDTVIVGGGPAGLSAALVLGRCRRRVLVCDAGSPRNARSRELHGFLTRDGIAPTELLRLGREELRPYGIDLREAEVTDIRVMAGGSFEVALAGDSRLQARTVLIASGVCDEMPEIPGLEDCFGITVHHCPYCDGWEVRDRTIVVIGHGRLAAALALALKTWSGRVTLCSHGGARLGGPDRARLAEQQIDVREARIASLDHADGHVRHLVFGTGDRLACDAVFLATGQHPRSDLPRRLGCTVTRRGLVKADLLARTGVAGLYVAGDASRDVQFAIVAAAEGAKAAVAINKALQEQTGLAVT
jgi:thioredoxin reductase